MIVHHVFPYHHRHLRVGFRAWAVGQRHRWPVAPTALWRQPGLDVVIHVISGRRRRLELDGIDFIAHAGSSSGPFLRPWGNDASAGLEAALRSVHPGDLVLVHGNGTYASDRVVRAVPSSARLVGFVHGDSPNVTAAERERVDTWVVIRPEMATDLVRRGVPEERIHRVLPSVADPARLVPLPPPPPLRLGYLGRVCAAKGIGDLPDVLAALRARGMQPHLELVGARSLTDHLRLRWHCLRRGLPWSALRATGNLARAEAGKRLAGWHVMVLPSPSEGFSLAAMECLRAGVPVVAREGVLPSVLADRPLVHLAPIGRFADAVLAAVPTRGTPDDWPPSHREAAAELAPLLTATGPGSGAPVGADAGTPARVRHRPVRRMAAAVRHRARVLSVPARSPGAGRA